MDQLITSLKEYKVSMSFKNKDFNADKPKQYEEFRGMLAKRSNDNVDLFGPESLTKLPNDISSISEDERKELLAVIKDEKEKIKKGYSRVMEKIKKIRQALSNAVLNGSRSGSGKLVVEYYDQLVEIYGGTASAQPLGFGCESSQELCTEITNTENLVLSASQEQSLCSFPSASTDEFAAEHFEGEEGSKLHAPVSIRKKRSSFSDPVQLIDNKRQHLEKGLSARQRDQLLLKESKEDSLFRRELCESIKQSNETFAQAIRAMSSSFIQVAESMRQSVEALSNNTSSMASVPPNSYPQRRNMNYDGDWSAVGQSSAENSTRKHSFQNIINS